MIRPYQTDVHQHHNFKYAQGEGHAALLLGVELEVSVKGRNNPENVSNEVDQLLAAFCICTFDRSVHNGFEIKAAAATYQYHLTAWDAFFAWNDRHNKLLETHNTCGTHVTIDRERWFTDIEHAGRFACFINSTGARRVVEKVAEREANQFCPYEKIGPKSAFNHMHGGHRSAVCTHKGGGRLMEVRIFQGRVNKDSLIKNLEFVMAVKDFTAIETKEYRSARVFLKWIRTEGRWKAYPYLYRFLKAQGLIKPRPVQAAVDAAEDMGKRLVPRRAVAFAAEPPVVHVGGDNDNILLPPRRGRGRPRKVAIAPHEIEAEVAAVNAVQPLRPWEVDYFNEVRASRINEISEMQYRTVLERYRNGEITFLEAKQIIEGTRAFEPLHVPQEAMAVNGEWWA